jgi:diamine N-acetyltransferase
MVALVRAAIADAAVFHRMEQDPDTQPFIFHSTLSDHIAMLSDPDLIYLRIESEASLAGFFILALDKDGTSVEFRRIVVADKGKGTGQRALQLLEVYCRTELGRSRIWLDVFAHNARGRYIYEKLGYAQFGENSHDDARMFLYEKRL